MQERIITRSSGAGGRQRQVQVRTWVQQYASLEDQFLRESWLKHLVARSSGVQRTFKHMHHHGVTCNGHHGHVLASCLPMPASMLPQEVTVMFNLVNEPWPKYNMQVRLHLQAARRTAMQAEQQAAHACAAMSAGRAAAGAWSC